MYVYDLLFSFPLSDCLTLGTVAVCFFSLLFVLVLRKSVLWKEELLHIKIK